MPIASNSVSTAGDVMRRYHASVFETLAIMDNSVVDPETKVALPSEADVAAAKQWVDENRL